MLLASTVGDVIRLHDSLQATPQHATLPAPAARLALNVLGTILAVLPAGWLGAARSALMVGTAPDQNMAVRHLLGSLGWAIPQQSATANPRIVAIGGVSMTTGAATFIQLQPQRVAQYQRQLSFICAAASASPQQGQLHGRAHSVASLSATMRTLWTTRWDNHVKETLWRLSVKGIAGAGGHDIPLRQQCPCGGTPTPGSPPASSSSEARSHCFWHCPVAKAVVAEIHRALPGSDALSCADVWLLSPPSAQNLHKGPWALICMAALHAMELGRRHLWRAVRKANKSLVPLTAPEAAELVTCTSARAAIWLWALLQDFADLQDIPKGWDDVQADHPCIGIISSATGDAEPRLCLNRPVA